MSDHLDRWVKSTLAARGISEVPARLFKFVSPESQFFPLGMHELLLHSRIYLSSRADFNDPYDSTFAVEALDNRASMEAFVDGFRKRNPERIDIEAIIATRYNDPDVWFERAKESLERSFDDIGIYSLADTGKHPLMWAHYACSHRGFALIYKHGTLESFGAMPIRYDDAYPSVRFDVDGIDVLQAMVKGQAWIYEGEWRLVESHMANQWKTIEPDWLSGVVFGMRVREETLEFMFELMQRRHDLGLPGLHVYRARKAASFEIQFDKLGEGGLWKPAGWPLL